MCVWLVAGWGGVIQCDQCEDKISIRPGQANHHIAGKTFSTFHPAKKTVLLVGGRMTMVTCDTSQEWMDGII